MAANKLVANPDKTEFMMIQPKQRKAEKGLCYEIQVGETKIKARESLKLLGMRISANLKFGEHIKDISGAISRQLGVVKRLAGEIPKRSLIPIIDSLILSKIRYGISIYGTIRLGDQDAQNTHMLELQRLQNNALRILHNVDLQDKKRVEDMLRNSGFLSVNQMAVQTTLNDVIRARINELPYLSENLSKQASNAYRISRSLTQGNLQNDDYKGTSGFIFQAIKLWNRAPQAIKNSDAKLGKPLVKSFARTFPV